MSRLAIALVLTPFVAACGALIGASWDGTLREADVDASPDADDVDAETDAASDALIDRDASPDARDVDAALPKTCSGDAKYCVCRANMPKEDGGVLCSVPSVGGADAGFCCEDKSWPIAGKCTCSEFKCDRTSADFCSCRPLGQGSVSSCSGALCCYSPSIAQCSCYDTGAQTCPFISGDEVRVAACTLPTIPCGTNERRTLDCGVVVAQ